jgi:small ligand-binding sensory domain FIST
VLGRTPEGGLACATHIPANAAIEFSEQTPEAIVRSTWSAVSDALAPLEGAPARAALIFDCAGRYNALGGPGDQLTAEAAALRRSFGESPPPLAGLYTRGEVGRVRGAKGDRNHAVVVAAFA